MEEEDGEAVASSSIDHDTIHSASCAQLLESIIKAREPRSLAQAVNDDGSFVSFLQALVRTEDYNSSGGKCLRLLEHLWTVIASDSDEAVRPSERHDRAVVALQLIEALVSTHGPGGDGASYHDDDHPQEIESCVHYYGTPRPMSWSDLIAGRPTLSPCIQSHDAGSAVTATPPSSSWIPLLVEQLPRHPLVVACILAHLYHDSLGARSILIPQYWPRITAALVSLSTSESKRIGGSTTSSAALSAVSKLCAVILQHDAVTPGMKFLTGSGYCGVDYSGLTPLLLSSLLRSESTATSAAWMLEGLTRREDEAVEALCRDGTLVVALGEKLRESVSGRQPPASIGHPVAPMGFLPTLRTVGNVIIACQGRFLVGLVEALAETVGPVLFQQGFAATTVVNEVLWVMGCCLFDCGRPMHVATTTLAPLWIPLLVSVLTERPPASQLGSFEVKRQTLETLSISLSVPPDIEAFRERSIILELLDTMLLQYVWNSIDDNGEGAILSSLMQLIAVDDTDTTIAALRLLQRLLNAVPSAGPICRSLDVLDRLHEVSDRYSGKPSLVGDLASAVLEAMQEDDESDYECATVGLPPPRYDSALDPMLANGTFSFGLSSTPRQKSVATFGPVGRGRGRTLPSWMEQQQAPDQPPV
jgi:hypothetical protein